MMRSYGCLHTPPMSILLCITKHLTDLVEKSCAMTKEFFSTMCLAIQKFMRFVEDYMPPYPQELAGTRMEEGTGDFESPDQLSPLLALVLFRCPRNS